VSIIYGIFHWRVVACSLLAVVYSAPLSALQRLAGALCCGVTSESVCMLREMVMGEVGHFCGCYILVTSRRG
jgi:hypothetical protein